MSDLKQVYVNKDRTPLERCEWRKLIEGKKEKNEEAKQRGELGNWIIRNNRVVQGRPQDKYLEHNQIEEIMIEYTNADNLNARN